MSIWQLESRTADGSIDPLASNSLGTAVVYSYWHDRSDLEPMEGVTKKSYAVRSLLGAFGFAVAAPLVLVLAILLFRSAASERAQLEQRLLQVVNGLADDIDRDIDRRIALLETLATSPLLEREEWPAFYAQAKAALQNRAYLVLLDSSGRQLVNTFVPFGQAPPFTGDQATLQRMISSPHPVVSDLFESLVVKDLVFNISIPVIRDGAVRYIMSLGLVPADILRILRGQQLDPTWVSSVWDKNDTVIARSREHERYLGTKLPQNFRLKRPSGTTVFRTVNLDGESVLLSNTTSTVAEWRIAVSVPAATAEGPMRSFLWLWAGTALLATLVAGASALLFGSLLVTPLVAAAEAARAFGRGEAPPTPPSTRIREIDTLLTTLQAAGDRQRLLMSELSHRAKNMLAVVQAIVSRSITDDGTPSQMREQVVQRIHALARAHDLLTKREWSGASMAEIAAAGLAPYAERLHIAGPDLMLNAAAIQPLSLVLHELATNAAKYGSLSTPKGTVFLIWQIAGEGEAARFRLQWREQDGPAVTSPAGKGFGTTLLESVFPQGRASLDFYPQGLTYELEVPLHVMSGSSAPTKGT